MDALTIFLLIAGTTIAGLMAGFFVQLLVNVLVSWQKMTPFSRTLAAILFPIGMTVCFGVAVRGLLGLSTLLPFFGGEFAPFSFDLAGMSLVLGFVLWLVAVVLLFVRRKNR